MIVLIIKYYSLIHFNKLSYLIYRSIISLLTSFIFFLILGPYLIKFFKKHQIYQITRNYNSNIRYQKKNVPTMGGILILLSIIISVLLWSDLSNIYIWYTIIILVGFGTIGFIDDYKKIYLKTFVGLKPQSKILFLSIISIFLIVLIHRNNYSNCIIQLIFPIKENVTINAGIIYILLSYFILVGSSNAVNLTDGLDGLAIVPILFVTIGLYLLSFISGNIHYSKYFNIMYIRHINELTIFCSSIIGSGLGFLWFNTYPAKIFMGDVGSLPLGGILGIIAILLHQEIIFFIMSGIFVIETLSVIIQVTYFKIRKRRIFKMTPIHHHYELIGCPEPRLITRFWIISLIFMLLGLTSIFKVN
ncbi:MAG: phospho-N-acetylmuramoyl-pentapeptide-transferase [Buchnera aphidicola (Meitanaphis microgallis)]